MNTSTMNTLSPTQTIINKEQVRVNKRGEHTQIQLSSIIAKEDRSMSSFQKSNCQLFMCIDCTMMYKRMLILYRKMAIGLTLYFHKINNKETQTTVVFLDIFPYLGGRNNDYGKKMDPCKI
jgi:hypothetical protein